MTDEAWHQDPASRQLRVLPYALFMLVPHVGGFEGIGLRLHLENERRATISSHLLSAIGRQRLGSASVRDLAKQYLVELLPLRIPLCQGHLRASSG
jgi:hypothetical protein